MYMYILTNLAVLLRESRHTYTCTSIGMAVYVSDQQGKRICLMQSVPLRKYAGTMSVSISHFAMLSCNNVF